MMGHKLCFYGVKWLIIPKYSLLPFHGILRFMSPFRPDGKMHFHMKPVI